MRDKNYYEGLINQLTVAHPFWNSTDIAYEIILQGIISGYWKSGEKIPQDQLSTMLDMSRTPIRDACARLVDEDYLEKNDKNICQVKHIKLKDYIDFSEFRQCLEAKAAYLAARNISDELLLELELNIERFKKAEAAGDLQRAMQLDNGFHAIIAKASKNKYLYEAIRSFDRRKTFYLHILVQRPSFKFVVNKHTAILNAIRNNDEVLAEKNMISHIDFYIRNIGNVSL